MQFIIQRLVLNKSDEEACAGDIYSECGGASPARAERLATLERTVWQSLAMVAMSWPADTHTVASRGGTQLQATQPVSGA